MTSGTILEACMKTPTGMVNVYRESDYTFRRGVRRIRTFLGAVAVKEILRTELQVIPCLFGSGECICDVMDNQGRFVARNIRMFIDPLVYAPRYVRQNPFGEVAGR